MSIFENIKMALASLYSHKLRSILTMLGIIIGVGSVIAVVAIGQAGEAMLKSQFVGKENTIELFYDPSDEELQANPDVLWEPKFTDADISAIERIKEVQRVVTSNAESTQVHYRENKTDGYVMGISDAYMEVNDLKVKSGRTLLSSDYLAGNRTALVSDSFQNELLDGKEVLGEIIYINSQPVEIIGVLEKSKNIFDFNSNQIYLPMKTWQNIFSSNAINEVLIQAETPEKLQIAGDKAVNMLNNMHDTENSYELMNMEEITVVIGQITSIMTIIIGSVAGISLFVGGIGVMNIMLVSVTERTREVGVRMSLGATRGQILIQFLIESVTLTLAGGIIGMLLGTGAAMLVSYLANWPPLVSVPVVIIGILFSMLIGIIFGILPANKASKLDPINALRHE